MKKITFLFLLLITGTFAFAQAPTDNATAPPTRAAADVISIFSGEYTDVAGSDFNPNWGQAGFAVANAAFDPGTGNLVLAYPNFNYQGVGYGSAQNISGMEFLHADIYVDGTFNPNIFVISSGGEIAHPVTNTGAGTWISVDIPVAGITGDPANAIQFKFDGGNGSSDAIYVDNLYFWKTAADPATDATLSDLQVDATTISGFASGVENYNYFHTAGNPIPVITATTTEAGASAVITQATAIPGDATVVVTASNSTTMKTYTVSFLADPAPATAAPTPPTFNAVNVVSLYSDAYTDAPSNFDAGWCGNNSVEEVMIAGNATMAYKGNACQGIVLNDGVDVSGFNRLHVDIYIEAGTDLTSSVFNLKFVQQPGGAALEINLNVGSTPALTAGSWLSLDIPVDLTIFNGFKEFGITSNLSNKVWYDNLYVFVDGTASTNDFNLVELSAYPNPSSTDWNIKTSNSVITSVEVFNLLGKSVLSQKYNNTDVAISTEGLTSGIYLARVTTDLGTKSIKLIKY
tara:strand:- start:9216 stop:10766 length:1551 start_codon:yes stop_codon:yes gene_type:complete